MTIVTATFQSASKQSVNDQQVVSLMLDNGSAQQLQWPSDMAVEVFMSDKDVRTLSEATEHVAHQFEFDMSKRGRPIATFAPAVVAS